MGKYFTFEEFIKSDTAERLGIDNEPTDETVIDNIHILISVMDLIREEWTVYCEKNGMQHPQIIVNSGYRSEPLNKAVKGSPTSSHMYGCACDFKPKNGQMKEFQEFVKDLLLTQDINFDQLIFEKPKNGIATWLHLGLINKEGLQRRNIFTIN